MFSKISTLVKKIFSGNTEKKLVPSADKQEKFSGRKNRNNRKKSSAVSSASSSGKKQPHKKKIKEKAVSPAVKKDVPPMPSELKDIPVCDGKTRFLDFDLHKTVQFGIQHAGFEYCTPIQEMTLPPLLEVRDLAGKAQTGTGKTAAFLLASFTRLLNNPPAEDRPESTPRMVVLAPTRELAMQIHKDAEELGIYTGLNIAVVFGGMDHEKQRKALACQLDVIQNNYTEGSLLPG